MKILHVIDTLGVGGAERLVVMLLPELRRRGDGVAAAVIRPPHDLLPVLQEQDISVFALGPRYKWNLQSTAREIARLACRLDCDLIHAHLYFPAVTTALVKHLKLSRAATVVTFHNLAYNPGVNKRGPGLLLKKSLAAILYPRGYDAFTAVSGAVADHYAQALGLRGIEVIYNPVDPVGIDSLALTSETPDVSCSQLILPGRIVHEKGHFVFLQALSILRDIGWTLQATLAGDGPMRGQVESLARALGLGENVGTTGALEHTRMLQAIARADVVVLPSFSEGFPLTALEGMALSKPVVASSVGGLPEIIEHGQTGFLVPPRDPRALANSLASLMGDAALRCRFGAAGRRRVEQTFALPIIVDKLQALYERAIEARARDRTVLRTNG